MPDTVVIGGGPAGMFAALTAAKKGRSVLLLDGNDRLGHKLSITGKGRCNVTNDCDTDTLMQNIPRNARFLYSAFSQCSPQDVMAFFEQEGVPLKTERGRRVFPQSDRAADIVQALIRAMQREGVQIRLRSKVKKILIENGVCTGVQFSDGETVSAKSVLLAAGGCSYPRTGSDGSGFRLARLAGHTVQTPLPSLIPLETAEDDPQLMQGLSLKNVTLTVLRGEKEIWSEMGEMLFTHFGVSGPLVLSASSRMDTANPANYMLRIDMKPALTPEQLDQRMQRDFAAAQNKSISNVLRSLLPTSMVPVMLRFAGMDPDKKVHDITKGERLALRDAVKGYTLHVSGVRPISEAIVTRGGVSVKEVNPNTMESKLISGLFFVGEILDVDGFTGGYNLQIAFATGFCAGENL